MSGDEQYVLVLMAQVSTAPAMQAKLDEGGVIDRTLAKAPRLEDRLIQSAQVDSTGRRVAIEPEEQRVNRVVAKIARGLFVHRYGSRVEADRSRVRFAGPYNIVDDRPSWLVLATHSESFMLKRWQHVQRGVFSYIFVRDPFDAGGLLCIMDLHSTLCAAVALPHPARLRGVARYRGSNHRQLMLPLDKPAPNGWRHD